MKGSLPGTAGDKFKAMERAFVRDDILLAYQDRPEFDINPATGSVGYESRWAFGYCNRYGRNLIAFELRKLYEGAPEEVIKHFHSFAVSAAVADKDVQTYGKRNVGVRAKEFIEAYLGLTETFSNLADALGMVATQADIGKLDSAEVEYVGWWTLNDLKPIGRVIPLGLSFADFLSRCKDLFEVIKGLQKPHLLQMVVKLGLKKDQKIGKNGEPIAKLESLRLASTVGQLAHIAIDQGLNLIQDSPHFVDTWDPDVKISEFKALFALNGLRIASAHNVMNLQVDEALSAFGIDKATCHNGWGLALDRVYDEVITALLSASQPIRKSLNI